MALNGEPPRFREALERAVNAVKAQPWFGQRDVTLVRDLSGRFRVYVEPRLPADATDTLRAELLTHLGRWLAPGNPVRSGSPRPGRLRDRRELRPSEAVREQINASERRALDANRLYLIDRHVSKRGWVGDLAHQPPWSLQAVDDGHAPAIVTFFSHKGGVGRSTSLIATALNLTRDGQNVVVVDLDLEAPGLSTTLLAHDPPLGLVDWILHPDREHLPLPYRLTAERLEVETPSTTPPGSLHLIPSGCLDHKYLQMLARLDLQTAHRDDSLRARLTDLFCRIRRDIPTADIILVDARAGLHEVGGVLLSSLCHLAVFVGTTSKQSLFGLQTVARTLKRATERQGSTESIPLLVVEGLADSEVDPDFAARVDDILCAEYHGDDPPARRKGDIIALTWDERLRGRGGLLSSQDVGILTGRPYTALAEWIRARLIPLSSSDAPVEPTPALTPPPDRGASANLRFRELLSHVSAVIADQRWLTRRDEVTVVRDVTGRVRVLVDRDGEARRGAEPGALDRSLRGARDGETCQDVDLDAFTHQLRGVLGHWLAQESAVVCANRRASATIMQRRLVTLVHNARSRRLECPGAACRVRVVDRHVAKRGWMGDFRTEEQPWRIESVDLRTDPAIVVFFSHKGGVGRSTALVGTALDLVRRGRSVTLVDLDLEAPGLSTILLENEPRTGLIDWLTSHNDLPIASLLLSPEVRDWLGDDAVPGEQGSLHLLPAGSLDAGYLETLARIDLQAARHPRGLSRSLNKLFRSLRHEGQSGTQVILVDARAGLNEIGGVLLSTMCHLAVFVGTTNPQSRFGLRTVGRLLGRIAPDDPPSALTPIKVVQGFAGAGEPDKQFATEAHEDLCAHYFGARRPASLDIVRLPWDPRLRGWGGPLDPRVVDALTSAPYAALADWIDERFIRPLPRQSPTT